MAHRPSSLALLVCAAACASTAPAWAASAPRLSWGKPGVSLSQYEADALTCGERGWYTDVSHTEAAKVLKDASGRLEGLYSGAFTAPATSLQAAASDAAFSGQQIINGVQPEKQFAAVRATLQANVDQCLGELGYRRFRLTAAQEARLAGLKKGSPERREYLHGLASDPAVVDAQTP